MKCWWLPLTLPLSPKAFGEREFVVGDIVTTSKGSAPSPRLRGDKGTLEARQGWGEGQPMKGNSLLGKDFARKLRKSETDAERKIWQQLRNRYLNGAKFRRQHPVGPYVVDFICINGKLIIELDGSQHQQ